MRFPTLQNTVCTVEAATGHLCFAPAVRGTTRCVRHSDNLAEAAAREDASGDEVREKRRLKQHEYRWKKRVEVLVKKNHLATGAGCKHTSTRQGVTYQCGELVSCHETARCGRHRPMPMRMEERNDRELRATAVRLQYIDRNGKVPNVPRPELIKVLYAIDQAMQAEMVAKNKRIRIQAMLENT